MATMRTRELLCGAHTQENGADAGPTTEGWERVRSLLNSIALAAAEHLPTGATIEMTPALIRQVRHHPQSPLGDEKPFSWKPAFVRRSLGLAVVEACVAGQFRSPADAVGPVLAQALATWEQSGTPVFLWEPWCAGLPRGARVTVMAEAITWATALWSSFEWSRFPTPPRFGWSYDRWTCPVARSIRLKARTEFRVPSTAGANTTAMVAVSGGVPSPDWRAELAFMAVVAGLGSRSRPPPFRVMGLWPEAASHRTLELDEPTLRDAALLVERTLDTVVQSYLR
ncbi:MAG: hypothetical protein ACYDES_12250 [Acidimicrobiales bacterium]